MRSTGHVAPWLVGLALAGTPSCGGTTASASDWCEADLPDEDDPVELVLTQPPGPYYDVDDFDALLAEFERDHPGIDVTLDRAEGRSAGEVLGQLQEDGSGEPTTDILAVGGLFVPTLARAGAIVELDGCPSLRRDGAAQPWDAIPVFDGRTYGVTAGLHAAFLVYEPDELSLAGLTGPPADLDELGASAASLRAAGFAQPVVWEAPELTAVLTGNPLVTITDVPAETGRAVFQQLAGLYRDGLVAEAAPEGTPDDVLAIGTDDVAMQVVGLGALWGLDESLRDGHAPGVELDVAPVPGPTGPGVPAFGIVYTISSSSSDAERTAAAALLAWLDEPAQQARRHTFTDLYPTDPAAADHPSVQEWWRAHPLLAEGYRLLAEGAVLEGELLPPPLFGEAAHQLRRGIIEDRVDEVLESIGSTYLPRAERWDVDPTHWLECFTGTSTEVCDHLDPLRPS